MLIRTFLPGYKKKYNDNTYKYELFVIYWHIEIFCLYNLYRKYSLLSRDKTYTVYSHLSGGIFGNQKI